MTSCVNRGDDVINLRDEYSDMVEGQIVLHPTSNRLPSSHKT
jgi:hypothetical protein